MRKILIANRGEIALRIMKTAKRMGIKTVAIYSTIDRNSPHVLYADEAIHIGDNPSNKSYLLGDKIIEKAVESGVDAIHPGYGFLSENEQFAKAVEDHNIIFIGPGHHAIKMMGDKLAAKEAVKKFDIPMVPGIDRAVTDLDIAKKTADQIGYPVLIKAAAGGGGKGMRVVKSSKDIESQMERAISEAQSAFGDGSVFVEKYVGSPRHIEFQIMADNYGNIIHLFERECSIQRRHQKVVEEAPSSLLSEELRNTMGEAAIKVAKACDYRGAGTVEFLMDADMNFYFLEMNTRLQVEHPVTEFITGLDLVEEQIKIARGEKLSLDQNSVQLNGHALELRVYAEDSMNNFLPNIGTLSRYRIPHGKNIRLDDGYKEGMEIPIYYDPMISKLITYGSDRDEAIQLMIQAIDSYVIEGVETTLPFGKYVCEDTAFREGHFDTNFVANFFDPDALRMEKEKEAEIAALLALKLYRKEETQLRTPN
ncbi:acetyl-CoA carboxylase biotin carboxylase subunit [Lutimonas sp.]|uniref:acetyl-CoA carboxylase biotin carboxylase subunit n=1 Tax=Lutimonas sp. TaxID=1872403 RepID=UPI003D9BB8AC